jgi:3-deoxy-D-manno-octulosonate 8-phosphate phosphatase (KDO 8-P phosphatase)
MAFDFDGVFTDNKVWLDQQGTESVRCDRGDGLAFDLLRLFTRKNEWKLNHFILSTEKNPVVSSRAAKLKIPCIQGILDKQRYLRNYLDEYKLDPVGLVYIGNDLNDLPAMQLAGFSVAPSDAHPLVQQQASLVFKQKGGDGFLRAFIEKLLKIEELSVDQITQIYASSEGVIQ